MSWLSGLFGGSKKGNDSIAQTQGYQAYDPLQSQKTAVANPLSDFLSKQVGTGIGQMPTDENYVNRYNEFLGMNPSQYFDTNIANPALAQYKRDILPTIQEGFAGNLRGSGRFNAQTEGLNTFAEGLASNKAQFVPQFAQAQLQQGQTEFARQYGNWFNSLAVNNPILNSAINFLSSGKQDVTGSGTQFFQPQQGAASTIGAANLGSNYGSQSIGDFLKNPKTWIDIATLFAGG